MKTFITILLLYTSLFASSHAFIKDIKVYHDDALSYSLESIKSQSDNFVSLDNNDTNKEPAWLHITLSDEMESGEYIVSYNYADFDLISMTAAQHCHKFTLYGVKRVSFVYDKQRDSADYFVRTLGTDIDFPSFIQIQKRDDFYTSIDRLTFYLLLAGVVLGLIMMTAIYNGALYIYNKELAFLYYALMQIFMVGVLGFHTGMPFVQFPSLLTHPFVYDYLSLCTAFFAVLFTRSFLDTKAHLPYHDKILQLFILLIMIDMLYYPKAIIEEYGLYSITTAFFVYVGYKRMRQGYKPARFYFLGWLALVFGIVVVEHFEQYAYIDTMLVGSTIEAIMLAIALAYKIRQIQSKKEEQKELLIHQSRLASMGEMIGNIAHQWRQPLTNLSYIFMNIQELDDKKERSKKIIEGTKQLEFMSQTIDDFRDFYAPKKEKEHFDIQKAIQSVIDLMHFEDIMIEIKADKSAEVYNYQNQFKQVILNILSNAKEALIQTKTKEPSISIMIEKNTIMISDNAGGITPQHIKKIFDPYFSTKAGSSGIGLYMSKMIVQRNLAGTLEVSNDDKGAVFTIMIAS